MTVSTLELALTECHDKIHEYAAPARLPTAARADRRHETDWYYAIVAQHLAAAEDILLPHVRRLPDGRLLVSTYVDNARQLERSLRILKARIYGDSRVLHLHPQRVSRVIDQLQGEHERIEVDCIRRLCEQLDSKDVSSLAERLLSAEEVAPTRAHPYSPHTGPTGRLMHRLWRIADTAWDSAEGRVVPTHYHENPKRDSALAHYLRGSLIPVDPGLSGPDKPRTTPPEASGGADH
jgi:hypothetical protein